MYKFKRHGLDFDDHAPVNEKSSQYNMTLIEFSYFNEHFPFYFCLAETRSLMYKLFH